MEFSFGDFVITWTWTIGPNIIFIIKEISEKKTGKLRKITKNSWKLYRKFLEISVPKYWYSGNWSVWDSIALRISGPVIDVLLINEFCNLDDLPSEDLTFHLSFILFTGFTKFSWFSNN